MAECPLLALSGHGDAPHVRFGGKADMTLLRCICLLLTQSGHWGRKVLAFERA